MNESANASEVWGNCLTATHLHGSPTPEIKRVSVTTSCLTAFFTVLSLLGNTFYILAYKKNRGLQTSSNMLLLSVSVSGVFMALISQPLFILRNFMELYGTYNCILWDIQHLSFLYFSAVYLLSIFLISLDRLLATFFPLRYSTLCSKFRMGVSVIFMWCVGLLVVSFSVFGMYLYYSLVCPLIIATTIFVVAIYLHVLKQARIQRRRIQDQRVLPVNRNDTVDGRKAEKTVFALVSLMLIDSLPGITFVIMFLIRGYDFELVYVYGNWTETAYFFGFMLNPYIYCWRNGQIRRAMKGAVCTRNVEQPVV